MASGKLAPVALAVFLAACSAPAAADALSGSQTAQIGDIVRSAMAKEHLVGVEVGVGRKGALLFARGYGERDRQRNLPVSAATVFPIGSITKQFTAAAVMQLVDAHKIDLAAKVAMYLPAAPHASQITVRQLLDQTSGLPDYLDDKALLATILNGTVKAQSVASYVAMVNSLPLAFAPGTKWAYSNTNYALLGMIVAKASDMPFARYLTSHIMTPLGLKRTQILQWSVPTGSDVTRGYTYEKGRNALVPDYTMAWGNSAGDLASTVGDVIRWDGAFFDGSVITPQSVRTATTPPSGIVMMAGKHQDLAGGYAFGWVRGSDEGRPLLWHNGGLIGARAMNLVFPRDGLAIVVLTNATTANPEGIALRIARALYDARSASKQTVTPASP